MRARVCLLGGESSGKSTLALALGAALKEPVVEEYGRELWLQREGQLTFDDYLHIAQHHVQLEQQAMQRAQRWVIVDTSPLTTLFYCLDQFGRADAALESLASKPYELIFLCMPDFPFVQDGARRDAQFRQQQHDWYVRELTQRSLPYIRLGGELQAREMQALALLV